jgi:hypothetical protein
VRVGLVALAVGYALVAARTTPFTTAADVMTAIPVVLFAVAVVVAWPWRPSPFLPDTSSAAGTHRWHVWMVLVLAVLAWELAEYAARGSRAAHPTLSSLADAFDRHYLLKAALFFAWLCLCAAVVLAGRTRGTRNSEVAS